MSTGGTVGAAYSCSEIDGSGGGGRRRQLGAAAAGGMAGGAAAACLPAGCGALAAAGLRGGRLSVACDRRGRGGEAEGGQVGRPADPCWRFSAFCGVKLLESIRQPVPNHTV
eukprot:COSAG02_NODE_1120_length_14453_cov_511.865055_4_plen_112_part_00